MTAAPWESLIAAWLISGAGVAMLFGAAASFATGPAHDQLGHRAVAWVGVVLLAGLVIALVLQAAGVCTCLG